MLGLLYLMLPKEIGFPYPSLTVPVYFPKTQDEVRFFVRLRSRLVQASLTDGNKQLFHNKEHGDYPVLEPTLSVNLPTRAYGRSDRFGLSASIPLFTYP